MTPFRAAPAFLAAAAAVAMACGDTLVDHSGTDLLQQPAACLPGTASCTVAGDPVCLPDSTTRCGAACEDCTTTVSPPTSAVAACLPDPAERTQSTCGWECTGGLLKCTTGCCPAASLAAGGAHSCAITTAGALYCWGENGEGQVTGSPTAGDVLAPRKRYEIGVTAVAAGEAHTCAVVGGEVICWGRNLEGQAPASASAPGATALAAGLAHTCALAGGAVLCWGANDVGQTGGGTPIASGATALAAGRDHTCAVVGGEVVCWGSRSSGQLGDGSVGGSSPVPATVLPGAALVAAGGDHTCAAQASPVDRGGGIWDSLFCWGDAPGASFLLAEPQPLPEIPLRGDGSQSIARDLLARVAAGRTHTCFQKAGDSIQCFGPLNNWNQLGNDAEGPGRAETVPGSLGATAFATGADHSCAVFSDGGVRCWGQNTSGQLGDGTTVVPALGVVPVLGR